MFLSLFNLSTVLAVDNNEYRFERMWPQLEQPWYFSGPHEVSVAPDGSVYIADEKNHQIQKFSAEGEFIQKWGSKGTGKGQFTRPSEIAIAPDGSVYVVDGTDGRIQQFNAQGDFIKIWKVLGASNSPRDYQYSLAIAPDSSVYVADGYNYRIQQFSAQGIVIRSWGNKGVEKGQFNGPSDIAIAPDGSVYVSSFWNHRIQQFSAQGDFIRTWGDVGSATGQFNHPNGLAISSDGSVYVADNSNHRIQQFSAKGDFIRTWGSIGSENGKFKELYGIAIGSNGHVYVPDPYDNRLQQFNAQGDFIRVWKSKGTDNGKFKGPKDIAIAPDNSVYVVDSGNHRIQQFSALGDFIRTWGGKGTGKGQFNNPESIAITADGNVYIVDSGNGRIQQFNAQGDFIRTWGWGGSSIGRLTAPSGITIANDGSLYVTESSLGRIQQFSAQGDYIRLWGSKKLSGTEATTASDFGDLAVAPDGSVFVINNWHQLIEQFSPQGNFVKSWVGGTGKSGHGEFSYPNGLAIALDGSVYLSDAGNSRVQEFNAQGEFTQTWGSNGSGQGQFKSPGGIAVAPDGSVYIVDRLNHRVQKFAGKIKPATSSHPYKAIILAGGGEVFSNGRTNSIWNGTWRVAKKAYGALTNQAFIIHDEIKFLTAGNTQQDLDNNQKFDDLEVASKDSLRRAIIEWASDAADVVIYLANHGGPGKFKINGDETLTSEELNEWVSQLEKKIPGKITLIIEACNSASFFPQLARPGRYLLASAKAEQSAVIANDGLTSFSYTFWSEIATGAVVQTAFKDARQSMSKIIYANQAQNSQAETDGNSIFNQQDLDQLGDYCLGRCNKTAGAAPEVKPFGTANTLNGSRTLEFKVNINSLQSLSTVWAIVQRPDDISIDFNQPITFQKINLICNEQHQCKGRYDHFNLQGEYRLNVYAQDIQGEVSFPETLTVTQNQGDAVYPVQYDEKLTTVYLRDVEYQGQHYQAALELKGNKFILVAASLAPKTYTLPAQFDSATNMLTIPNALVFGKPYQARFKHLGNFEFELESAIPK